MVKTEKMDPVEIYADLKEKIIWLDFKPGHTLNQAELADSYGVSRNPLTIALTRLDAEEWVVRQGSHYVVSPLTFERIREITEIRSVLEVQANIWALHRITPEGMAELKLLEQEIRSLSPDCTNRDIVELDVKFHGIVFQACQNQQLAGMLDRMLCHYLRFWLSISRKIDKDRFFQEASDIIRAFEAKDEIRVRAASLAHIRVSLDEIIGISGF